MNPARDLLKKFDSALANDDFVPEAEEMCETFEAAADRIDALEAEVQTLMDGTRTYCCFCGTSYESDDMDAIRRHVRVCAKHPYARIRHECEEQRARADKLEAELAQLRKWVDRGLGACPLCAKTIWVQQVWQIAGTVGVGDGAQWRVDCNHPFVTAPHCCAWQGPVADTPEAAWKAAAEEMAQ